MSLGKKDKLSGKDLVTIGIYSVIYFVSITIIGFMGFIPVFIPLLAVFVPLIGGIPFMLFISKTTKYGAVTIFSVVNGILMFVTGMGFYAIITGIVFGIIADLIFKSGNYSSKGKCIFAYGIFSMWLFGNYVPFYVGRSAQFMMLTKEYGIEYSQTLEKILPMWSAPILLVTCLIFGILGGVLGSKTCRKHFKRAGIA